MAGSAGMGALAPWDSKQAQDQQQCEQDKGRNSSQRGVSLQDQGGAKSMLLL
jgi:hypothetical protein